MLKPELVLTSSVMIYDLTNQNLRFKMVAFLELVGVRTRILVGCSGAQSNTFSTFYIAPKFHTNNL